MPSTASPPLVLFWDVQSEGGSAVLIIHAHMSVRADQRDRFLAGAAGVAQATRDEPGNREYAFYESVEAANRFVLVERWDDQAALDAHLASLHFQEFAPVSREAVTQREVLVFDASGPRSLDLPAPS